MPLSDEVRRELAAIEPHRDCDRLAELSGLFHTAGSLHLRRRGEFSVHLDVAEAAVARRAFGLLRSFGVEAEIRTYDRRAFDRATRYQIHVPGGERSLSVLHRAGVLSAAHAPLEAPPKRVVGRACCRHAYVRGAFLGGGSVTGPRSPHLEIRTASRAGADLLVAVAAQDDVPLRVHDRGRHTAVYAKGAETIADALALGRRRRRRTGARRARGRGGSTSAREPDRERGPREPRPLQSCRPPPDRGDSRARGPWPTGTSRTVAAGDRRAAATPSVRVAAGARRQVPTACDEGGGAPETGPSRCPRGRRRRVAFGG